MKTTRNKTQSKKYWSLEKSADGAGNPSGELYLYGFIEANDFYDDGAGVTPKELLTELNALGGISELNVHIFSGGGDVFAGNAIYSILKQRKETVNVYVEGIAASIATVIAMAADNLYIDKNAMFMIHNPMLFLFGMYNKLDFAKMAEELDRVRDVITIAYTDKTGKTAEEINALLDANGGEGTWFNAREAVAAGFCDAITPENKAPAEMAAIIRPNVYSCRGHEIDISFYKNPPKLAFLAKQAKRRGNRIMGRKISKFKMELLKITCPHCQALLEFDTESLIVTPEQAEEPVSHPEGKTKAGYKNELFTIECPVCGGEFEIDSAAETAPLTPGETDPVPQARKGLRKKHGAVLSAKKPAKPKARALRMETEQIDVTCTECETEFTIDAEPSVSEIEVICPNCGAELTVSASKAADEENVEIDDEIVAAIQTERRRLMTLDERAKAFPQYANAIEQFKKNGTSIACANDWIFKALAANPQPGGNGAYLAAAKRDAFPFQKLGNPARINDKQAEAAGNFNGLAAIRKGTL